MFSYRLPLLSVHSNTWISLIDKKYTPFENKQKMLTLEFNQVTPLKNLVTNNHKEHFKYLYELLYYFTKNFRKSHCLPVHLANQGNLEYPLKENKDKLICLI